MPKMNKKGLEEVTEPMYQEIVKKPYHRFTYTEEVLKKAVDSVKSGKLSLNKSSILYKIPRSTLHSKLWEKTPTKRKMGPTPVLTPEEENKIKAWAIDQIKLGVPMNPEKIKDDVQKFLKTHKRENPFKDDRPGRKWLSLFLQRHPDISKLNSEVRSKMGTEENIREWFNDLLKFLETENASDILNDGRRILVYNELGLSSCNDFGKLVTNIEESFFGDYITAMSTFSADGTDLPVTINYPCITIYPAIINSIPDKWTYAKAEGRTIEVCFHDYVANVVFPWLKAKNVKFPVILFRRAHENSTSEELSKFCTENKIILYNIRQHASHIVYLCNVILKPLELAWNKLTNTKSLSISMENFAEIFYKAFKLAINTELIQNAFLLSGIFPFDANFIKYNKCLAPKKNTGVANILDLTEDETISKSDLSKAKIVIEEMIGEEKVRQFRNGCINSEDVSLYSVWRKCCNAPEEYFLVTADSPTIDL